MATSIATGALRPKVAVIIAGIITLTLITAGVLAPGSGPPFWVILSAGLAIALGTYMGGWRIIPTLGKRVSEIQTPQGFAAETSAATVILASSHLGFALSTTQVATGAIFGAGAGQKLASVQWGVAGQMALAWLFTLPAAAAVGAVAARLAGKGPVGTIVVVVVLVAAAAGIYAASRRRPINAHNVNDRRLRPVHHHRLTAHLHSSGALIYGQLTRATPRLRS
jgi:inorganic phosphate transporter, PiT family